MGYYYGWGWGPPLTNWKDYGGHWGLGAGFGGYGGPYGPGYGGYNDGYGIFGFDGDMNTYKNIGYRNIGYGGSYGGDYGSSYEGYSGGHNNPAGYTDSDTVYKKNDVIIEPSPTHEY